MTYANEQNDPKGRDWERPDYDDRHFPTKAEIRAKEDQGDEYWQDVKKGMK